MKCPKCGYSDPFMRSWFDVEREVAEPCYFKEWDPELWGLLQSEQWVEMDGHMYHLTRSKRTVVRYLTEILAHGIPPQERSHRQNWHLLGQKLVKAETEAQMSK